jgi:hypothetical protein
MDEMIDQPHSSQRTNKMKTIITTAAALILAASTAMADGPSLATSDPVVTPLPKPAPSFTGLYAGLSFGNTEARSRIERDRSETTQEEWDEPVMDTCEFDGIHSGGKKCTFDDGVDIADLFPGIAPCEGYSQTCDMGNNRVFIKGASGDIYTYDTGETETFYGPEITEYFTETVTKFIDEGQVGGFVGYRFGSTLIGGIEIGSDGTMSTLEASAGYQIGRALPYAFAGVGMYDDEDGTVYGAGADFMLRQSILVGGKFTKGEFTNTDTETFGVRVAFKF